MITHHDWDHIFGLSEFSIPMIAHRETKIEMDKLRRMSWTDDAMERRVREGKQTRFSADNIKKELGVKRDIEIPLPDITFQESLTLYLGNVSCFIEHVGGDHASDSSTTYVPEEKVLFVGGALYPNTRRWSYTPQQALKLVKKLQSWRKNIRGIRQRWPKLWPIRTTGC